MNKNTCASVHLGLVLMLASFGCRPGGDGGGTPGTAGANGGGGSGAPGNGGAGGAITGGAGAGGVGPGGAGAGGSGGGNSGAGGGGPDGGAPGSSGGKDGGSAGGGDAQAADVPPAQTPPVPAPGPGVLTRSYDLKRTGANLGEVMLKPGNVKQASFGKQYCRPVDHEIYGQILYVPGLDLGARGKRNVVYVVTMQSSVYAFDADDPSAPSVWEKHFATNGLTPVPTTDVGQVCIQFNGRYNDISQFIGIMGTPVIDPTTQTIYFVARFKQGAGSYVQRLHALSLVDGSDRAGSPVIIEGSVPGTGQGSVNGVVAFNPQTQNQRPGLLLSQGVVYIAWASHCDQGPYHGWVIGYDAKTLKQAVVYNTSPNGQFAGIWMAGQAPAVDDAGNIYIMTGNGTADLQGGPNRGNSFIKLQRQGATLALLDYFTPFDYQILEQQDRDLGSAGALLIPGRNIVLGGGKEGRMYILNTGGMGKFQVGTDNQIIQSIDVTGGTRAHLHGTPVYWKSSQGEFVYVWGEEDFLKQYRVGADGHLTLVKMSAVRAPNMDKDSGYTMPGGILTVSADADKPGSGIVWASMTVSMNAIHKVVPGVIRAFSADDVSQELWNSQQNPARDNIGNFAKFNPVTVYNGRVYVPTFSKQYCVYGNL